MNTSGKIFIIGAGAIGKALAVLLTNKNRNVVLLRASTADVRDNTEEINIVVEGKQNYTATVPVSSLKETRALNGLVVLTSKSYGNPDVVNMLRSRIGNSPVVVLQNGLGVENVFIDGLTTNVYRCVLLPPVSSNKLSFTSNLFRNL